jgi:hypothetical protein
MMVSEILSACYFFLCDNFNHVYLDVCGFLWEVYGFLSTAGGKILGSGDCNSWSGQVAEDGWLGKGIIN